MLSLQEILQKTEDQQREIKRLLGTGIWHPEEASIYGTKDHPQKPATVLEIKETLSQLTLSELLAKSGTTGIAGAIYLIPDKLYDTLVFYSKQTDKVPIISAAVAERWNGGDLTVSVVNDETYKPQFFSSGGALPHEEIETMQPTISPKSFGITLAIGNDLIEDGQWDMVEFHVSQAAKAMGEKATSLAIEVLGTATDGWGLVNGGSSGDAGVTKWYGATIDVLDAIAANLVDGWISNTIVTSSAPWNDQISITLPTGSSFMPVKDGFTHCVNNMDILLHTDAADLTNDSSKLETIVFDRNNAILTGRKRWMEVKNYGDPVRDLAGAVISARQDSVTLYDDAICVIVET